MRKIVARLVPLILAMTVLILAGCQQEKKGPAHKDQADSVQLWYAYNTENIMQDLEYPELMESRCYPAHAMLAQRCGIHSADDYPYR